MPHDPVSPDPTPEARALLAALCALQGKGILSGQHNQMPRMSVVSERVREITGKYPALWGGEWGFSDERHDTDNIGYRPRLMQQIREQHTAGRVIVVSYHQASPAVGEPCEFEGGVLCQMTDAEWAELLSPGSAIRISWEAHVDRLAEAFLELQADGIPIIFRPYHEMSGGWFWWGGNPERFLAVWRMIFDRFTKQHGLRNLLWAWNSARPEPGFEAFYPGHEMVDLLGTDIYPSPNDPIPYHQVDFDRLAALAEGRPIALAENSLLPPLEILADQPYVYFMGWDGLTFKANTDEDLQEFYRSPFVVSDSFEIA